MKIKPQQEINIPSCFPANNNQISATRKSPNQLTNIVIIVFTNLKSVIDAKPSNKTADEQFNIVKYLTYLSFFIFLNFLPKKPKQNATIV